MLSTLHWDIAGEAHGDCSRVDPGLDTKEKSKKRQEEASYFEPPSLPSPYWIL